MTPATVKKRAVRPAVRIINESLEMVPVGRLSQHPRNANQGDLGAIHESILHNGFWGTVVAQKATGYVLAGNHRLVAAQQAGAEELPVAWVDVDNETALRILLADNRTTRLGQDDPQALVDLLKELAATPDALSGTGFDGDDLDELLAELNGAPVAGADPGANTDLAESLRERWGTERGQVWAIPSATMPGKSHRVMCGDSTSADDVGRLMGGELAGMVFTDPPYGVGYDGGTKVREKLAGDQTTALYEPACEMAALFSGKDSALYLWHAGVKGIAAAAAAAAAAAGYEIRCELIWNKNQAQFGALSAQYKQKHEPCYYCFRRGTPPRWFGPANEVTVWDINRASVNEFHPTQKPPELAVRALGNSSRPGDIVLDLFGGSGSTMVGAEQVGRIGYLMEIDPGYVAVILERLTGMGLSPHRVTRDEE